MTKALFAPSTPVEIAAAGYEARSAQRGHDRLHHKYGRRAEPTAFAKAYRDAAESAFEDVIARIAPRPAD
ncbi:hypothetical protein OG618_37830 (plasmid) [Kitasatospora sp. NBC_01246]|uniref:hypothetical protein n=1 Tax=Kitasatospora sp. NBC_01246 TaxID=2903570 RepID=UPI002E3032F3|nr:hypothetical protein [Kitasatospora sp. NBC_01246]